MPFLEPPLIRQHFAENYRQDSLLACDGETRWHQRRFFHNRVLSPANEGGLRLSAAADGVDDGASDARGAGRTPAQPPRCTLSPLTLKSPVQIVTAAGQPHPIDVPDDMPLLCALRDLICLNDKKCGYRTAQCGACAMPVDGQATRSCVTLFRPWWSSRSQPSRRSAPRLQRQ
jgi:hypothetical protein